MVSDHHQLVPVTRTRGAGIMTLIPTTDGAAETTTGAVPEVMAIAEAMLMTTMKTMIAAVIDRHFHRHHRSRLASPMIPLLNQV
jgi:hypothetical protein